MDSYNWTYEFWLTFKLLHSSDLCEHWVPLEDLPSVMVDRDRYQRMSLRNLCCRPDSKKNEYETFCIDSKTNFLLDLEMMHLHKHSSFIIGAFLEVCLVLILSVFGFILGLFFPLDLFFVFLWGGGCSIHKLVI